MRSFLLFWSGVVCLTFSRPPQKTQRKSRRISSVFKNLELKMHTKNIHTHTRAHEFSGAFRSRRGRYVCASDHKTLSYFLFFGCIFFNTREREREKSNHLFSTKKEKKRAATFLFFLFVLFFLVFLSVVCSTLDTFFPFLFLILPLRIPSTVVVVVVVARRLRRRNTFPSRVSIAVRCSREKRRFLKREKSAQGKRSYILKR